MPKSKIKTCKHHGETEFILESRGYYRCKKCRSEHVVKWRQRLKKKVAEYKGGKCEICGYDKCLDALEFHHLIDSTKEFSLGQSGKFRSLERNKKEADKCILVCANCHREIHAGLIQYNGDVAQRQSS